MRRSAQQTPRSRCAWATAAISKARARDHTARARLQHVRQRAAGAARGRQRRWRDRQLDGAGRLAEARIGDDDSPVGARPLLHVQERDRHRDS
jgi:hypothetical protein